MTVFEANDNIETALHPPMDVYAIYLRKSRADLDAEKHGEEETLARHKKILTELAARKGLYVGKIYQEVVSGETIEARPQIQELIKDCYAGMYRGIIIVEVTRLSRGSQGDAQVIMDCLRFANGNNGLLVVTPTKVYDVAHNSDDEEYMEFELFMSRREYKMIKKRMDRGRKQAVVEGNYMGSYRPYGYDILKTRTARTLVPNKAEAPIVKLIFDLTVKENMTAYEIAKRLDNMGVPTYTGESEWSRATVKTILTNPTYTGKVRWNDRMQVRTMVDGKIVKSRPRSNHTDHYMLYDGKHKAHALVSEEIFMDALSRYKSDKTKANLKLVNPLAGLLYCPKCNKAMVYNGYKHKKNVAPRYRHTQSQKCKVKSVVADDVMKAVAHALRLYIEDFETKVNGMPDVDESTVSEQLSVMEAELRKTEKKVAKLFDAWEDGHISDNEFVQRKAVNNEKIESIRQHMAELEDSIPEKTEYEEMIHTFSDALCYLEDDTVDAEVKNEYLKAIFSRIEFTRENNEEFILDFILR